MYPDFAGVKQITLPPTAKLVFQHQGIKEKLYINSGANAIKWAYTLNQKSQSTIGGEVVQLLSCYVGPMSIEGLATSPDELNRIRQWFLEYFERAGTVYKDAQFRDETACTFKYPARGWSFYIQPTNFGPWEQDNQVYTPPWSITAEIVSDNALNYLSGATMTAFTGPLSNPAFISVGYSDPTGHGANSRFINPQWDSANADIAGTMGDNFQRLVASYLGGSFADQAFNSLIATPGGENLDAKFKELFGGTGISTTTQGGVAGPSGSGSSGVALYSGSTTLAQNANAQWITDVLKALGVEDTVQNRNFMYSWWLSEGGGGFAQGGHNAANFNWLNTTLGSQFPAINGVGVRSYPDYQTGITYTVNTIKQSNLSGILLALQSGDPYADSADALPALSTWVSGSPTGNLDYGRQILGRYSTAAVLATDNSSSTGKPSGKSSVVGYDNPYRDVSNLGFAGYDQGVDFSGDGPVYAIGNGVVTFASASTGWPGVNGPSTGAAVSYRLSDGPAAGKTIYFAEHIDLKVGVGDRVTPNTQIAYMHNSYPYTESGWAQDGTDSPMSQPIAHSPTFFGVNFGDLLIALGESRCQRGSGGQDTPLPPGWPTWL